MATQAQITLVQSGRKQKFRMASTKTVGDLLEKAAGHGFTTESVTVKENSEGGRRVSLTRELGEGSHTFYLTANITGGNR